MATLEVFFILFQIFVYYDVQKLIFHLSRKIIARDVLYIFNHTYELSTSGINGRQLIVKFTDTERNIQFVAVV